MGGSEQPLGPPSRRNQGKAGERPVFQEDEEVHEEELSEETGTTGKGAGEPAAADAAPTGGHGDASTEPVDPLEAAQAEASDFKEKLLRMAADFDNYRKRSRREVQDAEKRGRDSLLKEMLPVFDNLERAADHASGAGDNVEAGWKGLSEGINLVMRQFHDTLGRLGLERVESVGKPFDPAVHEAIQHLETDDHPPGAVAAEVQAGYVEGTRLLRPALVVVAKAKSKSDVEESGETGPQ
jgi:molecular chaperone GrpE